MWQHWQTPRLIQQIVPINTMCHLQRPPGCWLPGLCQLGKGSIPAKLTGRKIKGRDSGETWHRTAANLETWVHPCRKESYSEKTSSPSIITHWVGSEHVREEATPCCTVRYHQAYMKSWPEHCCNTNSKPALYPHSPAWLPGSWGRSCRPWRRSFSLSANLGLF